MKKILITLLAFGAALTLSAQTHKCADPEATLQAQQLLERLWKIRDKGIMYGHQDDLLTGYTWWEVEGNSDTKSNTGDYPAIAGCELGELELGHARSLDSVSFAHMRKMAKWFHDQGGIMTVSWHLVNPITSQWPGIKEPNGAGSAWEVDMLSADGMNAVRSVLPGGENNAMFNTWLDRLARFFLSWKDDDGNLIPFLFRPYHEHSGSFFWWGRGRCYDEEYAALFRYTVDYLRGKGLHNILFMYNTDKVYSKEEYLRGYPGDDYCDMISIDWYGQGDEFNRNIRAAMDFVSETANEKGKLFALSECGPLSLDLQKILPDYKCSYVLTWRNAMPRRPRPGGFQPRPDELLKAMKADRHYLFFEDIKNIK
jgi:mannan endo-1,4-beta-mannosidase